MTRLQFSLSKPAVIYSQLVALPAPDDAGRDNGASGRLLAVLVCLNGLFGPRELRVVARDCARLKMLPDSLSLSLFRWLHNS